VYTVTFIAGDGSLADTGFVAITVTEAGNQFPTLDPIGPQTVAEDANLNFVITASDPDSTVPALSAANIPVNATFIDNGDGSGTFDFNPDFTQAGTYNVTFIASDGSLTDSEIVAVTVTEAGNQFPVITVPGSQAVDEGANLNFIVTAVDPDGVITALRAENLPANATFVDNIDNTGTFDFNPDYTQAGIYNVTFITNDGSLEDTGIVTITVNNVNLPPVADAGVDQFNIPLGVLVTLDGSGSSDPDFDPINYNWTQIAGPVTVLSDSTAVNPTFTPAELGVYTFELVVDDNDLFSAPDTVSVTAVNAAPPLAIADLSIQRTGESLELAWSPIILDTSGLAADVGYYVIYRGTSAYFSPTTLDSIGATDPATQLFTDADLGGVNVVGDTLTQYFYTVQVVDIYGNRSELSNRVGEYDYQIIVTSTTDYNLIGIPFTNTGITDAVGLISALGGAGTVNTVNSYVPSSQSYVSRFAAGFGTNFAVVPGGIYQVNAAAATVFTVVGSVPDSGSISYPIITTATTDYNFLMIPFEYENDFSTAQDVINHIPGVLNTLNNFVPSSQSYISRFAAGFGTNFTVRAGKPYQGNAATGGAFPE
jgi:PKD repeat protein